MRETPEPGRRRPGRPALTSTEDILVAAEQVGLDRLTRAAVAKRLRVSAATIRHHVTTAERLYSLACARVFDRLVTAAEGEASWQGYARTLSARFAAMIDAHPGIEDYVLRGPYEPSTLVQFERIMEELMRRDPRLDRSGAHLIGSRVLTLTAAHHSSAPTRYPAAADPAPGVHDEVARWTLEAFIRGADQLIDEQRAVEVTPTPEAAWSHLPPYEPPPS